MPITEQTLAVLTPAEAETLRAQLAVFDQKQREEAVAERAAYLQPLRDIVEGDAFKLMQDGLSRVRANYAGDENLSVHVGALISVMGRLKDAVR